MNTSKSGPLRVDFVLASSHGLPGRLGLTFAPGKRDWKWARDLATDLDTLRIDYRVDVLVSLLEDFEFGMLGIPNLVEEASARNFRVVRFPIQDGHAPDPERMPDWVDLITAIVAEVAAGRVVAIHCRGGLGRAGTAGASFLVARGISPARAIAQIREVRSPAAVESRAQEEWIEAFATTWAGIEGARDHGDRH